MAYDVDDLISTARKRLEQARTSDQHNREQARLDLQFLTLQQWDESQKTAREKQTPPRPCIVADRLTAFWNQVTNEVRRAQPSPRVAPRGSGATKATAEIMEGIVRRILYDSDSQLAFTEAAKYAIGSSFGAFRMDPELVNEDTNQHEIRVSPIYDPSTVYWDPFAKRPDKSDARWCLVVNVISRTEYAERWPDAEQSAGGFTAKDADVAEWLDPNGDKESVMVAEYWCVEEVGNAVALDKASDGKMPKSRGPRKKRVVCHIIDGVQELEEPTERPGKYIPIFQVEGNSVWVNGLRYVLSLIRGARDPQRILNWQETRLIELLAVQSNAPFWLTPKQAEGHEEQLRNAPNQNHFYLPYNPDPSAPGPPQRQNAEVPIAELSQAIAMKAQELRDIIGLQAPNLGGAQSSQQSGFAIEQLRTEGDTGTYHFTANLERTLKHFCRVLMDWIPVYYDVEQEMRILKADMTEDLVTVNSQNPVQPAAGGAPYLHDLTQGNYE
ncbi:MAG TPA: portal protein, partial [Candidatus Binatus sp.]|nr:portal protein [Candidatus Binatus sp.]